MAHVETDAVVPRCGQEWVYDPDMESFTNSLGNPVTGQDVCDEINRLQTYKEDLENVITARNAVLRLVIRLAARSLYGESDADIRHEFALALDELDEEWNE